MLALVDTGAHVNCVTPAFAKKMGLEVKPTTHLMPGGICIRGVGKTSQPAEGYVEMQVQVDEISGYDEPQVAIVLEDTSDFAQ